METLLNPFPPNAIQGLCDLQAESEGLHAHGYPHPAHGSHSLILKLLSTGSRPLRVIPLRHGDGFMRQQLAHLFEQDTSQKHLHRERVPEHVGPEVHGVTGLIGE